MLRTSKAERRRTVRVFFAVSEQTSYLTEVGHERSTVDPVRSQLESLRTGPCGGAAQPDGHDGGVRELVQVAQLQVVARAHRRERALLRFKDVAAAGLGDVQDLQAAHVDTLQDRKVSRHELVG